MFRLKLKKYCEKTIEFSLYSIAFYIPVSNALVKTFITLSILAWLTKRMLFGKGEKSLLAHNFLSLPVLLYLAASLVTLYFSRNHEIYISHLILQGLVYTLFFFIVAETINTELILKRLLLILIFSAILVGIDGLYQHFTHREFIRNRLMVIADRVNGPFSTHDDFATYIISVFPVIAVLAFSKFKKRLLTFLATVSLIILFVCLLLTGVDLYTRPLSAFFWLMLGLTVGSKNLANHTQ